MYQSLRLFRKLNDWFYVFPPNFYGCDVGHRSSDGHSPDIEGLQGSVLSWQSFDDIDDILKVA